MQKRLVITARKNERTLLFIYYRGNGGLDKKSHDTYAVLQNGFAIDMERRVRQLAQI